MRRATNVYRGGTWSKPMALGEPGSLQGSVSVSPNGDAIVTYVDDNCDLGTTDNSGTAGT